jgi:hypothetical protein
MSANKYINFRITPEHEMKIHRLARELGISQSAVLRCLVENAEVQSKPVVSVGLKNNGRGATFSPEHTTTVVA